MPSIGNANKLCSRYDCSALIKSHFLSFSLYSGRPRHCVRHCCYHNISTQHLYFDAKYFIFHSMYPVLFSFRFMCFFFSSLFCVFFLCVFFIVNPLDKNFCTFYFDCKGFCKELVQCTNDSSSSVFTIFFPHSLSLSRIWPFVLLFIASFSIPLFSSVVKANKKQNYQISLNSVLSSV